MRKLWVTATAFALAAWSLPAKAGSVSVAVDGLRGNTGQILVAICTADTFEGNDCPLGRVVRAGEAPPAILFEAVMPGLYAVKVVHDANGNGRLDTDWLGIPTEGYGLSNNPPKNRRPTFDSSAFRVGESPVAIPVTLFYR